MIKNAILLSNTCGKWMERVAGTSALERQLFTLSRAGIQKVALETGSMETDVFRKPAELEIVNWKLGERITEPSLFVSGDVFFRIETIRAAAAYSGNWALRDERGEVVLRIASAPEALEKIEDLPPDACISLRRTDQEDILTWLLEGVRKDSDGFMARYFDRNISLAVTRQLLDTWIRPNHMTVFSTWIGLIGAAQFIYPSHRHAIAGALLIWLHTVLDGCDGEMARLTFRESRWGAWLDFWGDNIVHISLFACLSTYISDDEPLAPVLGALACLSTFGSALASARLAAKSRSREQQRLSVISGIALLPTKDHKIGEKLKKLEMYLAQRDFIYLLVICSLLNRETTFLWAAGVGGPIYFFILIYLVRHYSSKTPQATLATS